jgi:hypothetical protein
MGRILDKTICVHAFKIENSKYEGKCMHLQIELDGEKRIAFSGSAALMDQISKVPNDKFPFITTIKKINDHHEFT